MLEPTILAAISFLVVMLVVYVWASQHNLAKARPSTPLEYLWRLKQITGKSEYDIFLIAAKEKGWSDAWVDRHFRRYIEDQTLPIYVQEFIEDGKAYIEAYRPLPANYFDKKVLLFFSLFSILIIGGSFIFCLYIFPRIFPYSEYDMTAISRIAKSHIYKAVLLADNKEHEKACMELRQACELGVCSYYHTKKEDGFCQ